MIISEYVLVADQALIESGFFEQIKAWKTANQNHSIQVFKNNSLSDAEYEKVDGLITTMKSAENYSEYKKAFDRFCYFCHIVPRGVILKKYELKKGKKDGEHKLLVEYSYNTKKIKLPDDVKLYHMSKLGGIRQLLPFFRGKSVKGYMYDKARIYFTIRKNMPKFLADYKIYEKLHIYQCQKDIKEVYVDPLVWTNLQGAVYVETTNPIPVQEINKNFLDKILDDKEKHPSKEESNDESKAPSTIGGPAQNVKESSNIIYDDEPFDENDFLNFVTENGLIIDND